jgi:NSS family neurotransmitter:Na+ symporter
MDFWAGTFFIFVLALFQVIVAGWLFGVDNVLKEAAEGSRMRIPRSYCHYVIKYVCPAFLALIFVMWCYQNLPVQLRKIQENTVTQITVLLSARGHYALSAAHPPCRQEMADRQIRRGCR